ncbi:hypothetical protein GCM10025859_21730 [Alicyclobacillus fastidiosus]|nr:hypothetical protein GCM10025859_21730 [Alicyclobacillus fastidiosus]
MGTVDLCTGETRFLRENALGMQLSLPVLRQNSNMLDTSQYTLVQSEPYDVKADFKAVEVD